MPNLYVVTPTGMEPLDTCSQEKLKLIAQLPSEWFTQVCEIEPYKDVTWCWDTKVPNQVLDHVLSDEQLAESSLKVHDISEFDDLLDESTQINEQHAMSLSPERIERPLIAVCVPELAALVTDAQSALLIDGYHRLYARKQLGKPDVKVLHLSAEAEKLIRFPQDLVDKLYKFGLI